MPKTQDAKSAHTFKDLSNLEKGMIIGQHLWNQYRFHFRSTESEPEEIVARSKKTDYKNTIGRHLDHINMRYSVVQGKPFIDPKYIARHLKLLKNLKNYELWCKSVVWADECRCHIYQRNGKNHICLESDVYYSVFPTLDPSQIIATVVVWGCIWPGGMGPLFTLKDNMTPEERSDFLSEKFLEFYETLPGVCRGGCPYIRDKAALPEDEPTNKKKGVGFEILEWPENGPAFTPLEYLWNYMSDNLLLMAASPNTPEELEKTLHEEWNNIDAGISYPLEYSIGPEIKVPVSFEDLINQPVALLTYPPLSSYLDCPSFSDIRVTVYENEVMVGEQSVFNCHKVILAAASPLFDKFFTEKMDGSEKKGKIIHGVHPEIFKKILVFIYSSDYDVKDVNEASKIIEAAHRFELPDLSCYHCTDTQGYCQKFIRKNVRKLLSSEAWIHLDPESVIRTLNIDHISPPVKENLFYEAVLDWREQALYNIRSNSEDHDDPGSSHTLVDDTKKSLEKGPGYPQTEEDVEEAFEEMISLIRFNQMDTKYLFEKVEGDFEIMKSDKSSFSFIDYILNATSSNGRTTRDPFCLQDFSRYLSKY
ncbi:BTB/POZ domain-containing protein [Phycomyces blakesleeanus]